MWGGKKAKLKRGEIDPTFFYSFKCTSYLIIKSPNKTKKKGEVHINNTINYLGFKEDMFEDFQIEEDNFSITAYVKIKRCNNQTCPNCKSTDLYVKDYKNKKINHKHFTGKQCYLNYKQRRYQCKVCKKTFYEFNPFSISNDSISTETLIYVLEELTTTQSFKDVALKTGLSAGKIVQIFDKYVDIPREPLPKILGIDEFHYKTTGEEKYACILINNTQETPTIVDIIKDRKINTLSYYFQYIDKKERENVNFFVSDMYDGYKYIHDVWFPNSIHIIDTFHFIRLFTDAINRIRIRIMKQYSTESTEYYILKKYYFVLEMSKKKFKKNKVFFKKFGREMNYYDLLNVVLNVNTELREAYFIKDSFCSGYWKYTYDESFDFINQTILRLKSSPFPEYHLVANSIVRWKQEICNSYLLVGGKRITNARTEGFNNLVKVIKRCGFGYANFKRFRNRILHIQKSKFKLKIF